MDLGIRGKVALVTAASRGLGRASAEALAADGARIVVVRARNEESLRDAEQALAARGAEVLGVAADMTDPATPERLVTAAVERFGRLDIVVANAGGPPPGNALERRRRRHPRRRGGEPAVVGAPGACRGAAHAGRRVGAAVLHLVVLGGPAHPGAGPVQHGAQRPAGVGQDRRGRPRRRGQRHHAQPRVPRPPRHRAHARAGWRRRVMGDPADFGRVVAFVCSAHAGFVNGATIVVDGGATLAL